MARIVGFLYMSTEPISIPIICERLLLTKDRQPLSAHAGERKIITRTCREAGQAEFYEMNPRLWSDFLDDMRARAQKRIEITEDAIERSVQKIQKRRTMKEKIDLLQAADGADRENQGNKSNIKTILDRVHWQCRIGEWSCAAAENQVCDEWQMRPGGQGAMRTLLLLARGVGKTSIARPRRSERADWVQKLVMSTDSAHSFRLFRVACGNRCLSVKILRTRVDARKSSWEWDIKKFISSPCNREASDNIVPKSCLFFRAWRTLQPPARQAILREKKLRSGHPGLRHRFNHPSIKLPDVLNWYSRKFFRYRDSCQNCRPIAKKHLILASLMTEFLRHPRLCHPLTGSRITGATPDNTVRLVVN